MSRPARDTRAPRTRLVAALLAFVFASAAAGCLGDQKGSVTLRLTREGAPVAGEEVELRFENPPGGMIQVRTDAEGRAEVPARYRGLRFQVGTDCPGPGQCRRYYAPSKLDADSLSVELTGGVNYQ